MNASPQATVPNSLGIHQISEEADVASLCSLVVDDRLYGIDTRKIREVLGYKTLERVPLAPSYIGGIIPYRGDVLTVVSFRALLGLAPLTRPGCVLVFKNAVEEEASGLMVDGVGGVVMLGQNAFTSNPSTLDDVGKALYSGAFRLDEGLLIRLDPERLRPSRLADTGLFRGSWITAGPRGVRNEFHDSRVSEEMLCER